MNSDRIAHPGVYAWMVYFVSVHTYFLPEYPFSYAWTLTT